ncbi:hypothetical protein DL770_002073 [Monosporascus sp. CRB-9-2]|nr:hypothetical protein DL770_002073 [Monosporascus sp. CRB-9-2]
MPVGVIFDDWVISVGILAEYLSHKDALIPAEGPLNSSTDAYLPKGRPALKLKLLRRSPSERAGPRRRHDEVKGLELEEQLYLVAEAEPNQAVGVEAADAQAEQETLNLLVKAAGDVVLVQLGAADVFRNLGCRVGPVAYVRAVRDGRGVPRFQGECAREG